MNIGRTMTHRLDEHKKSLFYSGAGTARATAAALAGRLILRSPKLRRDASSEWWRVKKQHVLAVRGHKPS